MPLVISIPAKSSLNNHTATVQVVCDSTTREPRRLVIDDGCETVSVRLDKTTVRNIVEALIGFA